MARLAWNQVAAPNLAPVVGAQAAAGDAWNNAFAALGGVLQSGAAAQDQRTNAAILPQIAGIGTEAQVDPYLRSLNLAPNQVTPEVLAAITGLRGGVLGYEATRASTGLTQADTALRGGQTAAAYGQAGLYGAQAGTANATTRSIDAETQRLMDFHGLDYNEAIALRDGAYVNPIINAGIDAANAEGSRGGANEAEWLRLQNAGATRNDPLAPSLQGIIGNVLPSMGLGFVVTSGGQETAASIAASGEGSRTSSTTNHDEGHAGDGYFIDLATGERLDPNDPRNYEAVTRLTAAGAGGIGNGEGYMGDGMFHIGDTNGDRVWGSNFSRDTADPRLVAAWEAGMAQRGQVGPTQAAADSGRMVGSAPPVGVPTAGGIPPRNPLVSNLGGAVPDWTNGGRIPLATVQGILDNNMSDMATGQAQRQGDRTSDLTYDSALSTFQREQEAFAEAQRGAAAGLAQIQSGGSNSQVDYAQDMIDRARTPGELQAALAMGQSLGDVPFTPGFSPTGFGVAGSQAAVVAGDSFTTGVNTALQQDPVVRYNDRVDTFAGAENPSALALATSQAIPGLYQDEGQVLDAIKEVVAATGVSEAEAAASLVESAYRRNGPANWLPGPRRAEDILINTDDAIEFANTMRNPETIRAATEARSRGETQVAQMESLQAALAETIRIQTLNASNGISDPVLDAGRLSLENQIFGMGGTPGVAPAVTAGTVPVDPAAAIAAVVEGEVASPVNTPVEADVASPETPVEPQPEGTTAPAPVAQNGAPAGETVTSQPDSPPDERVTVAAEDYIRRDGFGAVILNPNISADMRLNMLGDVLAQVQADTSISATEKSAIYVGLQELIKTMSTGGPGPLQLTVD